LSGTTQVSRYQKGKTNLDFTGARDSGWQWHQLGRMQVCTSLQTDNHASTPPLSIVTYYGILVSVSCWLIFYMHKYLNILSVAFALPIAGQLLIQKFPGGICRVHHHCLHLTQ